MPKRRLGVVLLVPEPWKTEIDGLRRAVGDGTLGRIPAHLTLVPPVNVRDDRLPEAFDRLREAAASTSPLTLILGPPGTFLPANPVLFLEVGGMLEELHALRDAVFRDPFERDLTWPFVPHVTLADEASPDRINAAMSSLRDWEAEVPFYAIQVLEEQPGRVWTPIGDALLEPPALVGRGGLELELTASDNLDSEARGFAKQEWAAFDLAEFGNDAGPEKPFAIVARRLGLIVGIATGEILASRVAHLSELLVGQGERGTGVGSQLLKKVESLARERDCTRITLNAEAGSRAEAFYKGRGWVEEARLSKYNFGRDFVRLVRTL